jgi:hypothetical protein
VIAAYIEVLSREIVMRIQPMKLYLIEDFREAARSFAEKWFDLVRSIRLMLFAVLINKRLPLNAHEHLPHLGLARR